MEERLNIIESNVRINKSNIDELRERLDSEECFTEDLHTELYKLKEQVKYLLEREGE